MSEQVEKAVSAHMALRNDILLCHSEGRYSNEEAHAKIREDLTETIRAATQRERDAALAREKGLREALMKSQNCLAMTAYHLGIQENRRLLDEAIITQHVNAGRLIDAALATTAAPVGEPQAEAPQEEK